VFKGGTSGSSLSVGVTVSIVVGIAVVVAFLMFFLVPYILTSNLRDSDSGTSPAVYLIAIAIAAIAGLVYALGARKRWEKKLRLTEFASANGLVYEAATSYPGYPGAIFDLGSSRNATDHLRSRSGRSFDMGNYSYVTGSGKSRTTHTWGYLAFRLDRKLPHMVLDSRANNGLFGSSNLPMAFARDQVLSLEGDFDKYFTLYCPARYESDALYVFTPDLMALLVDEVAPFDVEIVDDWMFVYSAAAFNSTDPDVYERLFRIIDTVGEKTLSQTERYADNQAQDAAHLGFDRTAANTVAPQGRRLRRGVPVVTIIVVVVGILIAIVPDLLENLGR
jgi:hypothetical protein